jgi:hypothetical protein
MQKHPKQEILLSINKQLFAKGGGTLQELTLGRVVNFLTEKAFWFAETVQTVGLQIQLINDPSTAILLHFGYDKSNYVDCDCLLELVNKDIYYCSGSVRNLLLAMDIIQGLENLHFSKPCQIRLFHKGNLVLIKEMTVIKIQVNNHLSDNTIMPLNI